MRAGGRPAASNGDNIHFSLRAVSVDGNEESWALKEAWTGGEEWQRKVPGDARVEPVATYKLGSVEERKETFGSRLLSGKASQYEGLRGG